MSSLLSGFTGLRRSGSQGSLNSLRSVVDSVTNEQHFRSCSHCMMVSKTFILIKRLLKIYCHYKNTNPLIDIAYIAGDEAKSDY